MFFQKKKGDFELILWEIEKCNLVGKRIIRSLAVGA